VSKVEKAVAWTVGVILGIPFVAVMFLWLVYAGVELYAAIVDSWGC
jgi:hypothetical protein